MTTRSKTKPEEAEKNWPLPVPEAVLRHHEQTLSAPLRQWQSSLHVPPVLLITGIQGVGKRAVAYFLAQWALCEKTGFAQTGGPGSTHAQNSEGEEPVLFDLGIAEPPSGALPQPPEQSATSRSLFPCGTCRACQKALSGNWVDFREIRAGSDSEGGSASSLKIDQFRELKSHLGFGAMEGPFKITLITDADRMTVQAANSLLKLLEEPPPGHLFLLTAQDASLMLPTILSRCQKLRLRPLPTQALRELLSQGGVESGKLTVCATLAQGSWGRAWQLAQGDAWEQRKAVLSFVKDPGAQLASIVEWAASDSKQMEFLIDQLELVVSELVHWSIAAPAEYAWEQTDARLTLSEHAQAVLRAFGSSERARAFWLKRAERLGQARSELRAPINRKLLAQDLLLPWLEINAASKHKPVDAGKR